MTESAAYNELSGFPRLFQDYMYRYERIKDFFCGNPNDQAVWEDQFQRLDAGDYQRKRLAEIIKKHNGKFCKSGLLANKVEKLIDPRSVAVVTGQQAGLYLGPLYTVYKALTAVRLAEKLESEWKRPVVPVFWLEVDDHDFDEVRQFYLHSPKGELKKFIYNDEHEEKAIPVGYRYISPTISLLLDEISAAFGSAGNARQTIESMRNIYIPGQSFPDAFVRFFRHIFPNQPILFINPADPAVKRLAQPFFEQTIRKRVLVEKALGKQSKRITNKAYELQVNIRPGDIHLFYMPEDERIRLTTGAIFENTRLSESEQDARIAEFVDENSDTLSADVLLRPLLQDYLLPTVSYVAGPSEISYLAQLKELYNLLDIPMPVIYPRWSGTVVDEKTMKFLSSVNVTMRQFLEADSAELIPQIIEQAAGKNYDDVFQSVSLSIRAGLDELKNHAGELDKTLINMIDQSGKKIQYQVDKIYNRFLNSLQAVNKQTVDRSKRAGNILNPLNRMQERVFPILDYLLRYGSEFPAFIERSVSTYTGMHHFIEFK